MVIFDPKSFSEDPCYDKLRFVGDCNVKFIIKIMSIYEKYLENGSRNTLTFRPNQVKIEIIPKGHFKHFHKKIITKG